MSEFEDLFSEWMQHGISVETRTGEGGYGETYATAYPMDDVMVEETRRIVINADGSEQVSEATLYVSLSEVERFTDQSRVTLPTGRVAYVIAASPKSVPGLLGYATVATT